MKVKWTIKRLDGSKTKEVTTESNKPIAGDCHVVNGIPVKVNQTVSTALSGDYDFEIVAEEVEV